MLVPPVSASDHIQGPMNARVILVEYGDYECPYCGEAYPIVKEIQRRLGDNLCFAFRNFPLSSAHPHAEAAAEAAEAAGAQEKFWQMHDTLYENQEALDRESLSQYAKQIGLEVRRFAREIGEHIYAPKVREDFRTGVRSGVNGTPSFYVNNVKHDGPYDLRSLLAAIEAATS